MNKISLSELGWGLRNVRINFQYLQVSQLMYKELVGHTAVRKSNKLEEIIALVNDKMYDVKEPIDYINFFYFVIRVHDFDLGYKLHKKTMIDFKNNTMDCVIENAYNLQMEDLIRVFSDAVKLDPAIKLAHKLEEVLQQIGVRNKRMIHQQSETGLEIHYKVKLIRSVSRSRSPRLYS